MICFYLKKYLKKWQIPIYKYKSDQYIAFFMTIKNKVMIKEYIYKIFHDIINNNINFDEKEEYI